MLGLRLELGMLRDEEEVSVAAGGGAAVLPANFHHYPSLLPRKIATFQIFMNFKTIQVLTDTAAAGLTTSFFIIRISNSSIVADAKGLIGLLFFLLTQGPGAWRAEAGGIGSTFDRVTGLRDCSQHDF